ncbi:MAG TPA: beta-L-arabinofuranosidase domain-containing protein [Vicinamibacterales bacterium]|nr:beta-L-arabinofuranosidase domain-containing protein [Vicinamibacterales bacterium]
MRNIGRRDFLKAAPAVTGAMALAANVEGAVVEQAQAGAGKTPRLADTAYTTADYPLQAIPYFDVAVTDRFWKKKIDTNAAVTIPFEVQKLIETERRLSGNVLEAAILSLRTHPNQRLQAQVDERIAQLRNERWNGNNGFEVAAAYYMTTGRRDLLENASAAAARLYDEFQASDPPFSGGERDAINCIQLYRATRDRKHLDLAKHYLDIRGRADSVNRSRHNQSYAPVLEQREAVGHAVNCASLMVSLADVGVLTGIDAYLEASRQMWRDVVERKMYVTGGVGVTGNEGFGEPYALPNLSAYSETCAVLMFMTLNHRLFLATGDSRYVDVMERGMYNNAVDGVSTSGDRFFYVNRLASAGDGRDSRWARASLECCPPNLVRFLASMPGLIYAKDARDTVYVNLYIASKASFQVGGQQMRLALESEMPWAGASRLTVSTSSPVKASIKLRIPGWARERPVPSSLYAYSERRDLTVAIDVNGAAVSAAPDSMGYVSVDREWKDGDVVRITLPVEARRVLADQRVKHDVRRVAIERGPIVYCAEWPDVDGGRVLDLQIDRDAPLTTSMDDRLDGGAVLVRTEARSLRKPSAAAKPLTLVPYYLWANRGAGEMAVWLSTAGYAIGDIGPAGGYIFFENPNYEADGWRYLEAAPFDQSAGAKWGCFRRAIAGARATAIGGGRQNTIDILHECTDSGVAAALCANLDVYGVRGWFLPSRDELAMMYRNLKSAGLGDFRDGGLVDNVSYWTSSQESADMSHHIDFADGGRQHYDDKDFPRRVRAIRQI